MTTTDMTLSADTRQKAPTDRPIVAIARLYVRNRAAVFGALLMLAILGVAFVGPLFVEHKYFDLVGRPKSAPGSERTPWLGTDYIGRDIWAQIVHGAATTLKIAIIAAAIASTIGITIGALAGFFGGWVDSVLTRIIGLFQVLPAVLFSMVLVSLYKPTFATVTMAIGAVTWTPTARLARAEFLRLKNLEFVRAARAIGTGNFRLMRRVILPNAIPPLIVSTTLAMGAAILFESGLAFLGLTDPNVGSWGLMIGSNRDYILDMWWAVTIPGIAIFLTVLAISLIGDGLTDAFNPKLRDR